MSSTSATARGRGCYRRASHNRIPPDWATRAPQYRTPCRRSCVARALVSPACRSAPAIQPGEQSPQDSPRVRLGLRHAGGPHLPPVPPGRHRPSAHLAVPLSGGVGGQEESQPGCESREVHPRVEDKFAIASRVIARCLDVHHLHGVTHLPAPGATALRKPAALSGSARASTAMWSMTLPSSLTPLNLFCRGTVDLLRPTSLTQTQRSLPI